MATFVDKACQLLVNEPQNPCTSDITCEGVQKIKGAILRHYW